MSFKQICFPPETFKLLETIGALTACKIAWTNSFLGSLTATVSLPPVEIFGKFFRLFKMNVVGFFLKTVSLDLSALVDAGHIVRKNSSCLLETKQYS